MSIQLPQDLPILSEGIQAFLEQKLMKKKKNPQKKPDWQHADDLSYESGYVHKTQNKKHIPLYSLKKENYKQNGES